MLVNVSAKPIKKKTLKFILCVPEINYGFQSIEEMATYTVLQYQLDTECQNVFTFRVWLTQPMMVIQICITKSK